MRTIWCADPHNLVFKQQDPEIFGEAEFEAVVIETLTRLFPAFHCVLFGGTFVLDGSGKRPDVALIARDFSHWFVIEVELGSHSLNGHVLPQARAFVYGEPQSDCSSVLANRLKISEAQANTIVKLVPRQTVVVSNRPDSEWKNALGALGCLMLVVSVFSSKNGGRATELHGVLQVAEMSLGFGVYSAVDRSLRFPRATKLPRGEIQLTDVNGTPATWVAREEGAHLWATRVYGASHLPDGAIAQVLRSYEGHLFIRHHV